MSAFALTSLTVTQPVAPATTGEVTIVVEGTAGSSASLFIGGLLPSTTMSAGAGNTASYSLAGIAAGTYNGDAVRDEDGAAVGFQFVITTVVLVVTTTDETAAGANDGTATLTGSNGTDPYTLEIVELSLSSTANPHTFTGLPTGTYTARLTDSVGQQVTQLFVIRTQQLGCTDAYADNYDPAATTSNNSCTYAPLWRSAWQPLAVRVAAQAGQQQAFVAAELRVGFRAGHPLAAIRPLGDPLKLRATVGPDGYATFVLGPYLRAQLGADDGVGGYRLDLNSPTAITADLYVGYELRRADGTLLEHGYAVNAAVLDAQLADGKVLTPFAQIPGWAGYPAPGFSHLLSTSAGKYGAIIDDGRVGIWMPCPPNPLPVAWLAPGGGYGYWVFQGKTQFGDSVGDGQRYREASTGEQRYSDPGEAYQTFKASSGVFRGDDLLIGLRTLWRSPQAWAQLGGVWVPIVVERGSRDVGRLGVLRNEVPLSFQLAMLEWAQGQ